jgi:hypothetical protein
MTTTSLSEEMINNFVQLNVDEQKSVLQMVKTFLKTKKNNFAPQSLEDYNKELKAAMKAAKKGEVISVQQLEAEMKLW